jgi:putative Holliday junction resolvase
MRRVLAIDPGEARMGVAISDPTGLIARPLRVIAHGSRQTDARRIAQLAAEHGAEEIVVGVALDSEGEAGPQARRALRLIEALRLVTDLPIEGWDESGSTQTAISLSGRADEVDAHAAAVILQDYLDARRP